MPGRRKRRSRMAHCSEPSTRPDVCAQRTALRARCPLSGAGKETIFDDDTTDVGVDAVLSADVGDAPMRQRQYTARVASSNRSVDDWGKLLGDPPQSRHCSIVYCITRTC